DKAIDLVDEAASRVRMYKSPEAASLREAFVNLKVLQKEKADAISEERFDEAIDLRYREVELRHQMDQMRSGWDALAQRPRVTAEDIAEVVAMWTGVPVRRIAGEESERLLQMEKALHERVVGQNEAVQAISKAVRRARAGLKDPKRPIGTFMLLGPTGVGKTLLAKTLAEFLFGSDEALIKLDMSEFMERHNVSRLVGAPPGYVGYEEGGQLTEAVRRRPYCVVLLDEIEKAHPEAQNMLLQIMEDGHLSDAKGRRVDFRNAIMILTSNVGANLIKRASKLGFAFTNDDDVKREQDYESMRERVTDALKQAFRPEFINRLDGIMVFRHLTRDELTHIVDLELKRVYLQLSENEISLELTPEAKLFLAEEGYDPDYGARPLRRVVTDLVEDRLSEGLLAGDFKPGDTLTATLELDEAGKQWLKFEVTGSRPALEDPDEDMAEELLQLALA
ncbi:MAG: AAA family ATPase, partial [Anaerolineae bacterium]|nr:AAA family ATPase [Anaerolineae bacterium]